MQKIKPFIPIAALIVALAAFFKDDIRLSKQTHRTHQAAIISILNTFGSIDSAVHSLDYSDDTIESVTHGSGFKSDDSGLEMEQSWTILLSSDATEEKKKSIILHLENLGHQVEYFSTFKYRDIPNYSFAYKVEDHGTSIHVELAGYYQESK